MIYLVELDGLNPDGVAETSYFCTTDDNSRGGYIGDIAFLDEDGIEMLRAESGGILTTEHGTFGATVLSGLPLLFMSTVVMSSGASVVYAPRVLNPGTYERHLWRPGTTQGAGYVTVGVVEIANVDGEYDHFLRWDFDGRELRILSGDSRSPRAEFAMALRATVQSVSMSWGVLQINIRDSMAAVSEIQAVTDRYGGEVFPGHDPTIIETLPITDLTMGIPTLGIIVEHVDGSVATSGSADDLKGKYLPWVLGDVENITPPRVNAALLMWQISRIGIAELVGVQEGGAEITPGILCPNITSLLSAEPASGTYNWSLGSETEGSYFRLGSSPLLSITCHAREGLTDGDRTIAQIAKRLLLAVGQTESSVADFDAFDAKQSGVVGYYIDTAGATVGNVLDAICASGGAAWTARKTGEFEILRLEAPVSSSVVVSHTASIMLLMLTEGAIVVDSGSFAQFNLDQIISGPSPVTVIATANSTGGVPNYQVKLSYQRNWTPLDGSQVAGSVVDSRRDWLGQEFRDVTADAPDVWDPVTRTGRNPLSQPLDVLTYFRDATVAQAEADRLSAIYATRRVYLSFSVPSIEVPSLEIGATISIVMPRFLCDTGSNFLVTGIMTDHLANTVELFCWR